MATHTLANKVVLLTGGSGSFGVKFCEIVLRECDPKCIKVYSRGEFAQIEMSRKFEDERLRFYIGDVRDRDRLDEAMADVDVVAHAAALKNVSVCEDNPWEACQTNIGGARNVIEMAQRHRVGKVMAISTDKSVHPTSFYGATKMAAEKLFVQANCNALESIEWVNDDPHTVSYSVTTKVPKFSCCRYGNVLASRGSVANLFMEQKKRGLPLTITDPRMTRFWTTREQGVRFVLDRIGEMEGGEVFIPRLPSMNIMDLADAIAPKSRKIVVGRRPGEKLHEVLISGDEAVHAIRAVSGDNHFVIESESRCWQAHGWEPVMGEYRSDTNDWWLTKGQLRGMLKEVKADV